MGRIGLIQVMHKQIEITVKKSFYVDEQIAKEIEWLNNEGIDTVASCQGDIVFGPTALILSSSAPKVKILGYQPRYDSTTGYFEIQLKGIK